MSASDQRWLLVVTAVTAEATAVRHGLRAAPGPAVTVVVGGVGPLAAAASTAAALAAAPDPPVAVVSAGIGGALPGAGLHLGDALVASAIVAADLGAQTPGAGDGFTGLGALGFGTDRWPCPAGAAAARRLGLAAGEILTVSTATGTAARAAELSARYPAARGEAMEGAGVATGAALAGVPVAELRTVSNAVGPRDRAAWDIGGALRALAEVAGPFLAAVLAAVPAVPTASPPGAAPTDAPPARPEEER